MHHYLVISYACTSNSLMFLTLTHVCILSHTTEHSVDLCCSRTTGKLHQCCYARRPVICSQSRSYVSRNYANLKYYITKRLSVNCFRERAVTSSVSVNSLSSLPQQRCIYIHGDSVCIYASDGVGLYMGPRAA